MTPLHGLLVLWATLAWFVTGVLSSLFVLMLLYHEVLLVVDVAVVFELGLVLFCVCYLSVVTVILLRRQK